MLSFSIDPPHMVMAIRSVESGLAGPLSWSDRSGRSVLVRPVWSVSANSSVSSVSPASLFRSRQSRWSDLIGSLVQSRRFRQLAPTGPEIAISGFPTFKNGVILAHDSPLLPGSTLCAKKPAYQVPDQARGDRIGWQ
jgi:hypothetical protein